MNEDFRTLISETPQSHAAEDMNCHKKKQRTMKFRRDEIQKHHKIIKEVITLKRWLQNGYKSKTLNDNLKPNRHFWFTQSKNS